MYRGDFWDEIEGNHGDQSAHRVSENEDWEERMNATDIGWERREVLDHTIVVRNECSRSRGFAY